MASKTFAAVLLLLVSLQLCLAVESKNDTISSDKAKFEPLSELKKVASHFLCWIKKCPAKETTAKYNADEPLVNSTTGTTVAAGTTAASSSEATTTEAETQTSAATETVVTSTVAETTEAVGGTTETEAGTTEAVGGTTETEAGTTAAQSGTTVSVTETTASATETTGAPSLVNLIHRGQWAIRFVHQRVVLNWKGPFDRISFTCPGLTTDHLCLQKENMQTKVQFKLVAYKDGEYYWVIHDGKSAFGTDYPNTRNVLKVPFDSTRMDERYQWRIMQDGKYVRFINRATQQAMTTNFTSIYLDIMAGVYSSVSQQCEILPVA